MEVCWHGADLDRAAVPDADVSVQLPPLEGPAGACPTAPDALQPRHNGDDAAVGTRAVGDAAGAGRSATGAGDQAPAGQCCPACAERRPATAHSRAGSPPGRKLSEFVPASLRRSAARPQPPESAAIRPEARRPTRTPRDLPGPAAGRASGRGRGGCAGALPALSAAVSRECSPPPSLLPTQQGN